MLHFDILTIFPKTIEAYTEASILGRAQRGKLIDIQAHDLRAYSTDKHGKVDDTPYGGGAGMVMTVQPFDAAIKKLRKKRKKTRVIMTAASGTPFTQQDAKRLAKYDQLILLCGRYEGIDARVEQHLADDVFSIGPYVLTGGELPAMVMTDAIARMIPGVLGNEASGEDESHSKDGYLEYAQYTKPQVYTFRKGLKRTKAEVPEVLRSGNHKEIQRWREKESKKRSGKG